MDAVGIETVEKRGRQDEMGTKRIGPVAMSDIDPGYFVELTGRTAREVFSLHQYVEGIREMFRIRLLVDQSRDECTRMEKRIVDEGKRLHGIKCHYLRCIEGFERFLANDHEGSTRLMESADKRNERAEMLAKKKSGLTSDLGEARLLVLECSEDWRIVRTCREFLRRVAPYHGYAMKEISISESMADESGREEASSGPPELYLESASDLIWLFRAMESQNLSALLHLESLVGSMTEAMARIAGGKSRMRCELDDLRLAIEELESMIRHTEERANELEEHATALLGGVFRELVSSRYVLELRVLLEDAYTSCSRTAKGTNLDGFSMMRNVEKTYQELSLELDKMSRALLHRTLTEAFEEEAKAMRNAENAARKTELMRRLLASLKRTMEPARTKRRQPSKRSPPERSSNSGISTGELSPGQASVVLPRSCEDRLRVRFFRDNLAPGP